MKAEDRTPGRCRTMGGGALAAAAPVACAAHCVATPLLVLAAPALAPTHTLELLLMAASLTLATLVLSRGYALHRDGKILISAVLGSALWAGSELSGSHGPVVLTLHLIGALLLAGALVWNGWRRHAAATSG